MVLYQSSELRFHNAVRAAFVTLQHTPDLEVCMGADQEQLCSTDAKALPKRYASMTGTLVCLADNMLSVQVLAY